MFGGLATTQRDRVFDRVEATHFKRGENIFQAGDEPTHIYLVKSGLVGLFIQFTDELLLKAIHGPQNKALPKIMGR